MKQPPEPHVSLADWAVVGFGIGTLMTLAYLFLYLTAGANRAKLRAPSVFWLVLSGVIHSWVEFAMICFRSNSIIKNGLDLYATADYRYQDPMDSGTAAMEAITAVIEGPMCFAVAFACVNNKPWYHPLQMVLCAMQMYGLTWFTIQPIWDFKEGYAGHMALHDPFKFWVLAVGCNAPWAICPPILFAYSFHAIVKQFHVKND